jgi:nucleoside-diphosphate-sugar epimerase
MNLYLSKTYIDDLQIAMLSTRMMEKLKNSSVLITGATGLIGSFIVDILIFANKNCQFNIDIYALARSRERLEERFGVYKNNPLLHCVEHDVNHKAAFNFYADYIVHAAGNAYPAVFQTDPVGTIMSNVLGTYNLLEYANKYKSRRFLFVSSGEIYGQGDVELFKEDSSGYVNPIEVRSCYPSSKRTAETLCVSYAKQFGLDTVIARPCHSYGPNVTASDNRANVQFINNVLNRQDIVLKSTGSQIRSYCYIADCASAILTILLNGKTCDAYNIAHKGSIVTVAEFAEAVAEASGRKVVFEGLEDISKDEQTPITRAVLDASKLESLGWAAKNNIRTGVMKTLKILGESLC